MVFLYCLIERILSINAMILVLIISIMLTNFTLYILDLITVFMLNRKAKYILCLMMSFYVVLRRMNIE